MTDKIKIILGQEDDVVVENAPDQIINIIPVPASEPIISVVPSPGKVGPQGEQGEQGLQGLQGEKGDKGDIGGVYEHNQLSVSNNWIVEHNLGFYPNVSIVDSAGTSVEAEIWYDNINTLEVRFGSAISGKAYLS